MVIDSDKMQIHCLNDFSKYDIKKRSFTASFNI